MVNKKLLDSNELILGKIRFTAHDLGGHETARRLWRDYFHSGINGVVFIVDAHDRNRIPEAKRELDGLLSMEELASVPFLILGNKIDLGSACSEEELRENLGLYETYGKDTGSERQPNLRPVEVYMCSVVRKVGYGDGFTWLSQFL